MISRHNPNLSQSRFDCHARSNLQDPCQWTSWNIRNLRYKTINRNNSFAQHPVMAIVVVMPIMPVALMRCFYR